MQTIIRFFVAPSDVSGGLIHLCAEDTAHIRSLRLRPGELFTVCNGDGTDYICCLSERDGGSTAEIMEIQQSNGESSVACSVYIAFAKGDRLDYAVQKSVELGASDIVLFPSERCVAIPSDIPKKIARLQKIALETAMQCGRGRVPPVMAVASLEMALMQAAQRSTGSCNSQSKIHNSQSMTYNAIRLSLFFYECEEELHLKQVLDQCNKRVDAVSIVTGPEGGFEPHEAELAKSMGLAAVSLGSRILRCETAPVVALAAVMFYTGNL